MSNNVLHFKIPSSYSSMPQDGTGNDGSGGGSNGGGDDMLETRVAKLESDVSYIRRDIDELKLDVKSISTNMTIALEKLSSIKESLNNKPTTDAVDKKNF
ncbi:hypothetical protein [Dickeya oryzae]